MNWLKHRPLIVFVTAMGAGILIVGSYSGSCRGSYRQLPAGIDIIFVISTLIFLVTLSKDNPLKHIFGAFSFFLLGVLIISPIALGEISPDHIKTHIESSSRSAHNIEGYVVGAPEYRGKKTRLYVDVDTLIEDGEVRRSVSGKVQLTIGGDPYYDGNDDTEKTAIMRGDRVSLTSRLKQTRNFANPGGFDYEWWLERRGVLVRGYVRNGTLKKLSAGTGLLRYVDELRLRIGGVIDSAGVENAGIIKALSIGEKGYIPLDKKESFAKSGTSHLLAISGLHVGFVAVIFYLIFYWFLRRSETLTLAVDVKKWAMGASLMPVFIYGLMSGGSVSTQRAVIMVTAVVAALLLNKLREVYSTIALAAVVVLLISPSALWDVGFQLSFMAVITIVYVVPILEGVVKGRGEEGGVKHRGFFSKVRTLFFVSFAAILGTAPILAMSFNRVSLSALVSNSIIVPLVGFISVPLVLFSAAMSFIWEGLAALTLRLADTSLSIAVVLVEFFAEVPYSSIWVTTPTVFEVLLYYIILALFFGVVKGGSRRRYLASMLLISVVVLVVNVALAHRSINYRDNLSVTFLDIGQGDSALLEVPESNGRVVRMLIDGGGFYSDTFDTGRDIIAPYLWHRGIEKIDYILLSHPQRDHAKGLTFIADNFGLEEFLWSGVGELRDDLSKVLKERGVKVRFMGAIPQPYVMNMGEATVTVLAPGREVRKKDAKGKVDLNESSLVVRIDYEESSILFSGDIGERGEAEILADYRETPGLLNIDVLKVPHHGSRNSSGKEFIEALSPSVAVISLGKDNIFGFPHVDTLKRFEDGAVRVYRTDVDGAVTVTSDGNDIIVKGYLTGTAR